MSETKMLKVSISDEDHYYIEGKQFISLRRFFENRSEIAEEYKILAEDNDRLVKENNHLKALLKEAL